MKLKFKTKTHRQKEEFDLRYKKYWEIKRTLKYHLSDISHYTELHLRYLLFEHTKYFSNNK